MSNYTIIITALFLVVFTIPTTTYAKKQTTEQLQAEREAVLKQCTKNARDSTYRDCECYADAYLEEREKQPEIKYISVAKGNISDKCLDFENIAAFEEKKCLMRHNNPSTGNVLTDEEKSICACTGDFIKNNISKLERVNYKTIQSTILASIPKCSCLVKTPDRNCDKVRGR